MAPTLGWTMVVASLAFLALVWLSLQHKVSQVAADGMTVVAALGATCGGLLILDDVSTVSWVIGLLVAAVGGVVHRRALFRGAGPFRT